MIIESTPVLYGVSWQSVIIARINSVTGKKLSTGTVNAMNTLLEEGKIAGKKGINLTQYIYNRVKDKTVTPYEVDAFIDNIEAARKEAGYKKSWLEQLAAYGDKILLVAGIIGVGYILSTATKIIPSKKGS